MAEVRESVTISLERYNSFKYDRNKDLEEISRLNKELEEAKDAVGVIIRDYYDWDYSKKVFSLEDRDGIMTELNDHVSKGELELSLEVKRIARKLYLTRRIGALFMIVVLLLNYFFLWS